MEALLRLYLTLGGAGPVDGEAVKGWTAGWLRRVSPPPTEEETKAVLGHIDAGLAAPAGLPKVNLDAELIRQAREVLARTPLAGRVYAAIRDGEAARKLPEWRPSDQAGPEGDRVFRRSSGARFSDGVPGFYTRQGFATVMMPALPAAARSVRDLSWLLGPPRGGEAGPELETAALTLYLRDYAGRWDTLLNDITLVPAANPQALGEEVNILSGRSSPLQKLLAAVADETTLQRLPEAPAGASPAVAAVAAAAADSAVAKLVAQMVDDRFRPVNDFTRNSGNARLEELLRQLEGVHAVLARLSLGQGAGQKLFDLAANGGGEVFQKLATDMAYYPQPVRRWTEELVEQGTARTLSGARSQIAAEWQSTVLPWCRRALDNRYPFVRGASSDVGMDDFARMFAPGGLIDAFFANRLRPFVDTTREPWRWQPSAADLGIPASVLPAFQHAAMIRDAFFPDGGRVPSLRFELRPTYLGPGVEQVDLDVDGQRLTFARTATLAQGLQWPKPGGAGDPARHLHRPADRSAGDDPAHRKLGVVPHARRQPRAQGGGARPHPAVLRRRRQVGRIRRADDQRGQSLLDPRPEGLPMPRQSLMRRPAAGPAVAGIAGCFGKVPARGDFLLRGLPRAFADPWHDWLLDGLQASRAALADVWLDRYLNAPIWRFALEAGVCGPQAAAGVMMSSVDKAGRHFPLTLVALLAPGLSVDGSAAGGRNR